MTKEELKQKAEEYISDNCKRWESDSLCVDDIAIETYLAGAEPREKQIEVWEGLLDKCGESTKELVKEIKSLGERCLQLQKDKGNLTDRVKELKAQIEKMKCCGNCARLCECGIRGYEMCKNNYDKWELRR